MAAQKQPRKRKPPKLAPHHHENAMRSLDALVNQIVFRRSPMNRAVTAALLERKRRGE